MVGWGQSLEALQLIHTSVGPPLGLGTALLLVRIRCKCNERCCEAGTLLSISAMWPHPRASLDTTTLFPNKEMDPQMG